MYKRQLPVDPVPGDVNGLRLGTPEVVRRGMTEADMPTLAGLLARALDLGADDDALASVGAEVGAWRRQFTGVHYTADQPAERGQRSKTRTGPTTARPTTSPGSGSWWPLRRARSPRTGTPVTSSRSATESWPK